MMPTPDLEVGTATETPTAAPELSMFADTADSDCSDCDEAAFARDKDKEEGPMTDEMMAGVVSQVGMQRWGRWGERALARRPHVLLAPPPKTHLDEEEFD
jgi:hypothetical protein